jgi:hypothetical protein
MPEDFDVKQRTENIYERWRSRNNKKLSDKHSKEEEKQTKACGRFCNSLWKNGTPETEIQDDRITITTLLIAVT